MHNAMHSLLSLCPMHVLLLCSIGSTVEVLTDDSDALKGIYFQDKEMKSVFAAYPELSFIDAMYKLLELRLPVCIMLVEDGNGGSEIVAAFMLTEETKVLISKIMDFFKKHNPQWTSICVLMSDKDMIERDTLAKFFPDSQLLICLFHTFRSFRREITIDKMGDYFWST